MWKEGRLCVPAGPSAELSVSVLTSPTCCPSHTSQPHARRHPVLLLERPGAMAVSGQTLTESLGEGGS